ncbi:MAG: Flavoprotein, HI0933 family [Parcubacteria group bacterium GW2011_GWA2_38_13]|nr:MAG: Flavoprotein, HI0933 family [Parcubacteria group bacterium GW2011_GWA2_38_13]
MATQKQEKNIWDVAVIGGGAAGMMAAGKAAETGRSVVLLEKNSDLGRKLLLTGGGRCNLTNFIPDTRLMLAHYTGSEKFLFSAFTQFGVEKTIDFFHTLGVDTKIEAEGRVFPVSNRAQTILDALIAYMKEGKVNIQCNAQVAGISRDAKKNIFCIRCKSKNIIEARSCVVSTGGIAKPDTGSNGDGFIWLQKFGHTIIDPKTALVPITLKDLWVKKISGLTLHDIKLTIFQNKKNYKVVRGELLFTHFGISGPTVLNMSKSVAELMRNGDVTITLDVFPDMDHGGLDKKIQTLFTSESNTMLKNTLGKLVPARLGEAILGIAKIDGTVACRSVRREERICLGKLLKAIPLTTSGVLGVEVAIASSGGVMLKEINNTTMQSRLVPNLYIVGDALNIDRLSGGYSLQIAWTTGFVAGSNC